MCKGKSTNTIAEIGGAEVILFHDAIKKYQVITGNKTWVKSIPNFLLGKMGKALITTNYTPNSKNWETYINEKGR